MSVEEILFKIWVSVSCKVSLSLNKKNMKKIILFLVLAAAGPATFAQSVWKADKAHTQVKFDITHMGISTVSGVFMDIDANITASKEYFSDAIFSFQAKSNSITTGIEARDKHLKSPDFFDVAQFPELSFASTGLQKVSEGRYKLSGNLTLHGVTKPVQWDLWYRGTITNPMNKKKAAGFKVTGTIKRSDFGFGAKFPEQVLAEEVAVVADGEFGVQ